jgi:hypothetical protein
MVRFAMATEITKIRYIAAKVFCIMVVAVAILVL